MKALAYNAMSLLIRGIENEEDYDAFTVEIIDGFDIGVASKTTTKSFSFSKEDIREMQRAESKT